jgi:transcription elongation factor Elf1
MMMCPFCNEELRVSKALETIIGKLEVTIECEKCERRIVFRKEVKHKGEEGEYIKLDL